MTIFIMPGYDQSDYLVSLRESIILNSLLFLAIGGAILIALYFASSIFLKPMIENNRVQTSFLANTSHAMKTPLAIIKANIELLQEDGKDYEELSNIDEQVENMNHMVEELLGISSAMEKQSTAVQSEINVSDTINSSLCSFDAIAYESGITYTYDVEEGIMYPIDMKDLAEIMRQILSNAFKYVDERKEITCSFRRTEKGATLSLKNSGCTLEQEEEDKIFERFYRETSKINSTVYGSGIGLSLVKMLCDYHHMNIRVDVRTGESFTINIDFPIRVEDK